MNRRVLIVLTIIVSFVLFASTLQAQEQYVSQRTSVKEMRNGIEYFIHTVQPKETGYGIARTYKITYQELLAENPDIDAGLAVGQTLKIPTQKVFANELLQSKALSPSNANTIGVAGQSKSLEVQLSKDIQVINNQEYYVHSIESGQTLYSISRAYKVHVDSILKTNPEISAGLTVGKKIFIENISQNSSKVNEAESVPIVTQQEIKPTVVQEVKQEIQPHIQSPKTEVQSNKSKAKKNSKFISIVLLLPFQIESNNAGTDIEIINKKIEISNAILPFIEYYEGVLMAVDSLRKSGVMVNLSVIDTKKDSLGIVNALNKIKTENLDLIIGPISVEQFKIAADFAKKYKVPIVSPLSSDEIPIKNNPYAIQTNSPQKYRNLEISKFASQYKNANIIFVYNSIDLEQNQISDCKKILNSTYSDSISKNSIQVKEVYFPKLGISGVEKALSSTAPNILIVPSRNQAFINNLVTKLYQYSKHYSIYLVGLPIWEKYENVELDFLFDLQFQFVTNGYVDYTNPNVITFVQQYRTVFKTEPTKFSFQGFDQVLYFSECLINTKQDVLLNILSTKKVGLHDSYSFVTDNSTSGIVNTSVSMIYYTKLFEKKLMKDAKIIESPVKTE